MKTIFIFIYTLFETNLFYSAASIRASKGQSKIDKNFTTDENILLSHLIPVLPKNIADPCNVPNTAFDQPTSSKIILNPLR